MYKLLKEYPSLITYPALVMGALFLTGSTALYIIAALAMIGYSQKGFILPFIVLLVLLPFADSTFPFVKIAYNARPVILILLTFFVFIDYKVNPKTDWSFNGFILYFIVLAYYLYEKSTSIEFFKSLSYFLVIFTTPVVVHQLLKTDKDHFLRILVLIYTLIFVISFINIGGNTALKNYDRFSGIFSNPNALGIFSFLFLMLTQIIFKSQGQLFTKTERYIVTGLVVAGLLYSRSRSGMFAAAIFWFTAYAYQKWSFNGMIIAVASLFLLNTVVSYEEIVRGLGLADFLRMESIETGSGRKVAIEEAWKQIKLRPVEGYGIGYSESYFKENQHDLNIKGHVGGIHNSFQWVWLDLGLYGLIPFVWGWFRWFRKAYQFSFIAIPIALAVLFSANVEAWLMGSLNHVTIQLIIILSLLSSPLFINPNTDNNLNHNKH